jgi:phenylpropionate dioxygenase-like ring-hydroxylating dioxygenase large terminal subunit
MNDSSIAELGATLGAYNDLPYEQARSMPRGFYTDPRVLALEKEHLFLKQWNCVGRAEEVSKPGDFMSFDLCDEPVVIVHGEDGRIRAFSNVCRHRGVVIAKGRGNGRRLVCPYHNWAYDTLGRLAGTPGLGERHDFDRANCRLPEFACESWHGFLFVSLAADPPALAPQLAGLEALIKPYHMEQMVIRFLEEETWDSNWKCFVENYMEGYHLTYLHRRTLHSVNPSNLCRHYPPGDLHFGYYAGFSPALSRAHTGHPDLTKNLIDTCVMFAVAPGLVVGCAADYSSFVCIQPQAVDRVRIKMGLLFFGADWPQEKIDWAIDLYKRTMAEDHAVLAELWRGLNSRHHQVGPLGPVDLEGPTWDFYKYFHRHLGAPMSAASGARAS